MSAPSVRRIVVIGGGPTGRAAMACLRGATLLARPEITVWHAEPGRLWVEADGRVWAEAFDALLLCAEEPLVLAALGCCFAEGRPVVDDRGATTVPGVFVAGRMCGAATPEHAAAQARAAADALLGADGARPAQCPRLATPAAPPAAAGEDRRDPVGIAGLLETAPGPDRNTAALTQCALLGPLLPARPVGLAALANLSGPRPAPLAPQQDDERVE